MVAREKVVIYVCMSNYQNTKAAILRKWIQRALHMNEYMNKNEVVFMSDLCQEGEREREREHEEGRAGGGRGTKRERKKAKVEAGFIKGQDIITYRKCLLDGWAQKCI